ncbi:hypothetical protein SAMN05920897_11367 [Alkalispirochaeta americana]|uniref:Uncharacterized protein n=1 Tax=Alkalispirochaeta americana TaxID=159291 RepID=A0A1N6UYD7_9SPIO|nr:hypothetical protein [Alkalispirochaeta americana]SIQ70581.1 hypothetical protein SAMN05920897_11367 [Alkalispirochaeta americana]
MKVVQKVLVSLLLATVLFTGFAIAAYSGLFDLLDARFYNQRVRDNAILLLEEARSVAQEYQRELRDAASSFAALPTVQNVFRVNQSREDIEARAEAVDLLFDRYPEFDYLRIIDNERGDLWFSTLQEDLRARSDARLEYRASEELEPPLGVPDPGEERSGIEWISDPPALRALVPVMDSFRAPRGLLIAWASTTGLYGRLQAEGIIPPSARVRLSPAGNLVVNARRHFNQDDLAALDRALEDDEVFPVLRSHLGESYALERLEADRSLPSLVLLLNESDLSMDRPLQLILLGAVFMAAFLGCYLILNIRQDPSVVVAERFRRFQQAVVRDYLREGRVVNPEMWKRELDSRRQRIEAELRRGIGKLKEEERVRVEQDFERNWDELYQLMGPRSGGGGGAVQIEQLSLKQIEEIIERTLARHRFAPSASGGGEASEGSVPARKSAGKVRKEEAPEAEAVDELEPEDELEPLEELDSEDELEPVEEMDAEDELESLEELDSEDEVESLEELDAEDEVESLEELDAEDEVESLEELDAEDELEPLEELDTEDELEPLEELDTEDELEPLEELDSEGELESLEDLDAEDEVEPLEAPEAEAVDELEPEDELESLEELDSEGELEPLEELDSEGELESLEDLDAEDEVEPLEAPEAEAVDELEPEDELESLEELDSEGELEPLEELDSEGELESLEDLDAEDEVEPLEAPEAEAVDELEPEDELESLEELDSEGELESLEELDAEDELEPLEELDAEDELEPLEELDTEDELEPLEELDTEDELEPLEELDTEDELEPLEELDTEDELEPLEELDSEGELESLEELDTEDELEPLEELDIEDELEPLEELDSEGEPESLEELDTEDELEPLEDLNAEDELEPLEELDTEEAVPGEAPEAETIDELEPEDELEPPKKTKAPLAAVIHEGLTEQGSPIQEYWENPGQGPQGEPPQELFPILKTVLEESSGEEFREEEREEETYTTGFPAPQESLETDEDLPEILPAGDEGPEEPLEVDDLEELGEVQEIDVIEDDEEVLEAEELSPSGSPFLGFNFSFSGRAAPATTVFPESEGRFGKNTSEADEAESGGARIRGAANTLTHQAVELEEFVNLNTSWVQVIGERDGLVHIQSEAYHGEGASSREDRLLHKLVDQIVNHRHVETIDALFGNAFGDLSFEDILEDSDSGVDHAARRGDIPDAPLRLGANGFEFSASLEEGDAEVRQVYRQLVKLTRIWNARAATVLEAGDDNSITSSFSLGLPEDWSDDFRLEPECDLAQCIFPHRRVLLLKQNLREYRDFSGVSFGEHFPPVHSWLLLPLQSRERQRYLMVGFLQKHNTLKDLCRETEIFPGAVPV